MSASVKVMPPLLNFGRGVMILNMSPLTPKSKTSFLFHSDYIGNPLQGCRRECETDRDCSPSQQCSQFKCLAACREGGMYLHKTLTFLRYKNIDFSACGENANCAARNNRAECTCPPDFLGDARSRCYTECTRHDDCQDNQVS